MIRTMMLPLFCVCFFFLFFFLGGGGSCFVVQYLVSLLVLQWRCWGRGRELLVLLYLHFDAM